MIDEQFGNLLRSFRPGVKCARNPLKNTSISHPGQARNPLVEVGLWFVIPQRRRKKLTDASYVDTFLTLRVVRAVLLSLFAPPE
jgi:hypothetical protein